MGVKQLLEPQTTARPDDRGRITLGTELTKGVSRYDVYVDSETGEVLLKPFKEIPANEAWVYENETARGLVAKGLEAAKKKKFSKLKFKSKSWIDSVKDDE